MPLPLRRPARQPRYPVQASRRVVPPIFTNGGTAPVVVRGVRRKIVPTRLTSRQIVEPRSLGATPNIVRAGDAGTSSQSQITTIGFAALQDDRPLRRMRPRVFNPIFTNSGALPVVVRGIRRRPGPARPASRFLTPGTFTNAGAVPRLLRAGLVGGLLYELGTLGNQDDRPLRRTRPRLVIPPTAGPSLTPLVAKGIGRQYRLTRQPRPRIFAPVFTNGGAVPTSTAALRRGPVRRMRPRTATPGFTNAGVSPALVAGVRRFSPAWRRGNLPRAVVAASVPLPVVPRGARRDNLHIPHLQPRRYVPLVTGGGIAPLLARGVRRRVRLREPHPSLYAPPPSPPPVTTRQQNRIGILTDRSEAQSGQRQRIGVPVDRSEAQSGQRQRIGIPRDR